MRVDFKTKEVLCGFNDRCRFCSKFKNKNCDNYLCMSNMLLKDNSLMFSVIRCDSFDEQLEDNYVGCFRDLLCDDF